jgi:hypothetical protein
MGYGQQLNQHMYDRYNQYVMQPGGYPNATASGSPMNYGAYYPPTSYAASPAYNVASSGPAYRGGYQATTSYAASQAYTSTAGPSYSQYATAGFPYGQYTTAGPSYGQYTTSGANHSGAYSSAPYTSGAMTSTTFGSSGGYGNGYTATTGTSYNASYDPAFLTAMHNLSFNSK